MVMSRLTTSATLRSRNDFEARATAAAAAFSHDSVLVPTSSITLYTLSAMVGYLRLTPYSNPGQLPLESKRRRKHGAVPPGQREDEGAPDQRRGSGATGAGAGPGMSCGVPERSSRAGWSSSHAPRRARDVRCPC